MKSSDCHEIELGQTKVFRIDSRKFWVDYKAYEPGRVGVSIWEDTGDPSIPSLVVSRDFRFGDIYVRARQFLEDELVKLKSDRE